MPLRDAEHRLADMEARLQTHEAVCAERYANMFRLMEENQRELKAMRQIISMGSGAWKFILALGVVLTMVLTTLQIFKP